MNITIVGAEPRGLSVALYALYKQHKVTLIDPLPLHTWTSDYLIEDLEMRSPVTFDLVTFIEELQEFSLSRYLGYNVLFTDIQSTIEACNVKVTRKEFCDYLNWVYTYINKKAKIIKQTVVSVESNNVKLSNSKLVKGDVIVFCTGYKGKENNPSWLSKTNFSNKKIDLINILNSPNNYINKKWLVVGSGQGSAEQVNYFSSLKGTVYWVVKKTPKVNQYPAPNYQIWGSKSALGSYYRSLTDYKNKLDYLAKVKQWQPSITPYISSKLQSANYKQLIVKDYSEVNNLEVDHVSLASGVIPNINSLPMSVPNNPYLANFPDISNHFRINFPSCNWYVSGILATAFDGPRQHSLISAGLTAKEIIEDIECGNI